MANRSSGGRLAAFTFAALVAVQVGTRGDDWTQGGLNAARTNASSEISGSAFDLSPWSLSTNYSTRVVSTPAVADGYVVFGNSKGTLQAARAIDGSRLWQFVARDGFAASPAILKGRVYAPSLDGKLYALRLADGALLWQSDLGGAGYSS